jgi:hypothetical protein
LGDTEVTDRTFVELQIRSAIHTADDISARLGIQCDRGWRIGDRRGNSGLVETLNGWVLSSGSRDTDTLDTHLSALFSRIGSYAREVNAIAKVDDVQMMLAFYHRVRPALYFDADTIITIASLRATLSIDVYLIE